ncbi:uncharacterized protein ARMOST_17800 [Armillaria ostoyae]|uniref:Uncharacterized protein n=1 Tax=Armillaria ostoyae TaxID=47428 RepID=A0A284S016_ARMOS|nr:uncharacterized protein ARMOST_17800 [Armillaria ostoyae]
MSIQLVIKSIGFIINTIKFVATVRDLLADDAGKTIVLQSDFEHVIRAQNAKFFVTIKVSELEGIRNQFYDATLPTVTNSNIITSAELQPNGALGQLFILLSGHIDIVKRGLDSLVGVFKAHGKDLQIDDLVYSQFLLIRLYGLLLHMHSTYATLHRIQVGASSLDDPRLSYDTRTIIHYINSIQSALPWLNEYTWQRRSDTIGPLKMEYSPGGLLTPPTREWTFTDTYSSLPSTDPAYSLLVLPNRYWEKTQAQGEATRNQHTTKVKKRYEAVASGYVQQLMKDLGSLLAAMQTRLRRQEGVTECPEPDDGIPDVSPLSTNDESGAAGVEGQGEPNVEESGALETPSDVSELKYLPLSTAA